MLLGSYESVDDFGGYVWRYVSTDVLDEELVGDVLPAPPAIATLTILDR